jgi:threonine dehydratase
MIDTDAIRAAYPAIPLVFRGSPQFVSEPLSERLGAPVAVKVESVNPIGCFKGRGTWLAVGRLAEAREATPERGIVVASAGNFGQGVAYAARALGIPAAIHAPRAANSAKLEAMRRLGAHLRLSDGDFDDARKAAAEEAQSSAWTLLIDGQDPLMAVGAGSIGLELTDAAAAGDLPKLGLAAIPVGNGALICGIGSWLHATAPGVRVVGVQAEAAPSMTLSWRAGRPIITERADTVADGIATRVPVPEALEIMREVVDDMVLVGEAQIVAAQTELSRLLPLAIEPAAAVGWAALQLSKEPPRPSLLLITGGNVAPGPKVTPAS